MVTPHPPIVKFLFFWLKIWSFGQKNKGMKFVREHTVNVQNLQNVLGSVGGFTSLGQLSKIFFLFFWWGFPNIWGAMLYSHKRSIAQLLRYFFVCPAIIIIIMDRSYGGVTSADTRRGANPCSGGRRTLWSPYLSPNTLTPFAMYSY